MTPIFADKTLPIPITWILFHPRLSAPAAVVDWHVKPLKLLPISFLETAFFVGGGGLAIKMGLIGKVGFSRYIAAGCRKISTTRRSVLVRGNGQFE
jgi:hypothetical protein